MKKLEKTRKSQPSHEQQLLIIRSVVSKISAEEKSALTEWADQLLTLKSSDDSHLNKGISAIKLTAKKSVIVPIIKTFAKELKLEQIDATKFRTTSYKQTLNHLKAFWGRRSLPAKMGMSVGAVAAVIFGSQGAGIAALGTAVGVPLWVVFGAGASFLGMLYEELTGKKHDFSTSYKVIEGVEKRTNGVINRILNFTKNR